MNLSTRLISLVLLVVLALAILSGQATASPIARSIGWDTQDVIDLWVGRVLSGEESIPDLIYELRSRPAEVRRNVIAKTGAKLTLDDVRGAWARLVSDDKLQSDRWIVETFICLPTRHRARLLGPRHVSSFVDVDRFPRLWKKLRDAYEDELDDNAKIREKRRRANRRGKSTLANSYQTDNWERSVLRAYLELLRFTPKTTKMETALWKFIENGKSWGRTRTLAIEALQGSVDLKLLKRHAAGYLREENPSRTAHLRVLAHACREYRSLDSKRLQRLARIIDPLLNRYTDVDPTREETRAMIYLLSQQPGELGLGLVTTEAVFDQRISERVHAIRRLSRFANAPGFDAAIERVRTTATRKPEHRVSVAIAILEALVEGRSELAEGALREAARDPNPQVRVAVAGLSRQLPADSAIEILAPLLEDDSAQVVNVAMWSLYRTRKSAALDRIVGSLERLAGRGPLIANDALSILENATGQSWGSDVSRWVEWWSQQDDRKDEYQLPNLSAGTSAGFFEHRIYSHHVVFVLDLSGSMNADDGLHSTSRFEVLHSEVEAALRSLDPDVRFNVVAFADRAHTLSPTALPADPKNIRHALNFLADYSSGSTNYSAAFSRVFDMNDVDTVYFLSDGVPTGQNASPERLRDWLGEKNKTAPLMIHTVGIKDSSALLNQIADDHCGQYRTMTLFRRLLD